MYSVSLQWLCWHGLEMHVQDMLQALTSSERHILSLSQWWVVGRREEKKSCMHNCKAEFMNESMDRKVCVHGSAITMTFIRLQPKHGLRRKCWINTQGEALFVSGAAWWKLPLPEERVLFTLPSSPLLRIQQFEQHNLMN